MSGRQCDAHPAVEALILNHYGKNRCRVCVEAWLTEKQQKGAADDGEFLLADGDTGDAAPA